jgi:uncharacterized protein (DUF433 family)
MSEIVETPNVLGGKPRIDGRRIGVHHIVADVFDGGMSPERIAAEYDLDVADVYRAIAYYYDNPEEIRAIRERARERMEESERAIRPEDVGLTRDRERPEPDA